VLKQAGLPCRYKSVINEQMFGFLVVAQSARVCLSVQRPRQFWDSVPELDRATASSRGRAR